MASRGAIKAGEAFIQLSIKGRDKALRGFSGVMKRMSRSPGGRATVTGMISGLVSALTNAVANFATSIAEGALRLAVKGVNVLWTGIEKAVAKASEAETAYNRLRLVFTDGTADAVAFGTNMSRAFGRTRTQVETSLATFKTLFTGLEFGKRQSTAFAKSMTALSTDLAAFVGITDEGAMRRFVAALAGSPEVLDQFGINLKEAALSTELMARGLPKVTDGANEVEKTLARMSIMVRAMEMQGAVGATLNLAETFRQSAVRLKAGLSGMGAELGQEILPHASALLDTFTRFVELVRNWVSQNGVAINQLIRGNHLINDFLETMRDVIDAGDLQKTFKLGFAYAKLMALDFVLFLGGTLREVLTKVWQKIMKFDLSNTGDLYNAGKWRYSIHKEILTLKEGLKEEAAEGRWRRMQKEQVERKRLAGITQAAKMETELGFAQQKKIRDEEARQKALREAQDKRIKAEKIAADKLRQRWQGLAEGEVKEAFKAGRLPDVRRVRTKFNLENAYKHAATQLRQAGRVAPGLLNQINAMEGFLKTRAQQRMGLGSGGEAMTSGFAAQLAGNTTTANHISTIAQESKKQTRLLRNSGGIKVM